MEMRSPLLPKERKEYRLAEKLRRLRSLRGLSQREVAQAAGIDESTVRNYELARRMPKPEHVRGLAAALEVMPEALIPFDDAVDHNELFLMIVEIADFYGFEFGYNDDFAYIEPTRAFFAEGIERWSRAYAEMSRNEEAFREDYELWKDEFHGHFSKQDYPAVYPDYDPMRPDSKQRWLSDRFAAALKDIRRIYGFKQEELAERADLSLFTLRSYEQGKRMPRAKQMEALCEALSVTSTALTRHYFGSPNQAMHYLFAIARAANLTPDNVAEASSRLRTQGNMVEWAFVCLTDKLEELKDKSTTERHDELTHWLATFDCTDDDTPCAMLAPRVGSIATTQNFLRKRRSTMAKTNEYAVELNNCRNIVSVANGPIKIARNHLNVFYGKNGTGKTTLCKAIKHIAGDESCSLASLESFKYQETHDASLQPSINTSGRIKELCVFDDDWVQDHCFTPSTIHKDAFELYVRDNWSEASKRNARVKSAISVRFLNGQKYPILNPPFKIC